jgi:hypothetical protein
MTLANMRENGVHSVVATCAKCRHEGLQTRRVQDCPDT